MTFDNILHVYLFDFPDQRVTPISYLFASKILWKELIMGIIISPLG